MAVARLDRPMLVAQSADETAVAAALNGSHVQGGIHHHVAWATDVTSGVVEVECADSATYAGTWAPLATVTFAGNAPKGDYVYTPGVPKAIRHRISTVVAGGATPSVTTRMVGEIAR